MRGVTFITAWGPHDEQGNAIKHTDTLKPLLPIRFSCVFAG